MIWIGISIGGVIGAVVMLCLIISLSKKVEDPVGTVDDCQQCRDLMCQDCEKQNIITIRRLRLEIDGLHRTQGKMAKEIQSQAFMSKGFLAR